MRFDKYHFLFISAVFVWVSFLVLPELLRDRIMPWDAALFAANGAFFLSIVQEFGVFISNPIDWLWEYYNQYPTLAVRRHTPLFGITEMFVYLFTGVSVFGAKLTVFLYSLVLALGIYALIHKLWQDKLLSASSSIFVMSIPYVTAYASTVRLDVPALAFAVWALFHYVEYIRNDARSSIFLFVVFLVLSIYTYQLTVLFGIAVAIHLLLLKKGNVLRDRTIWLAAIISVILLSPLIIQQLYMAQDQIASISGNVPDKWSAFVPVDNKLSMEYWLYYPSVLSKEYPIYTVFLGLWIVLVMVMRREITQTEKIFVLCGLIALIFFTWVPSKNSRYTLYMIIPWSPLIIYAIRNVMALLHGKTKRVTNLASAGLLLLLAGLQAFALPQKQTLYLAGMHKPTTDIIQTQPNARILYTGSRDAAFGFYLRQNDSARKTRLYRAGVQVEHPKDIGSFIKSNNINAIVVELSTDKGIQREKYNSFITIINEFLELHTEYKKFNTYLLKTEPRGSDSNKIKNVELIVYTLK